MKKVVLVHCWGGNPDYCWYPWLKKELAFKGYSMEVPNFGQADPKMNEWVPKLFEVTGTPNEDLVLVGHSIGCATILRYLENLEEGQKVGGVVLVAGFTDDLSYIEGIEDELKNYFESPLDYGKIRSHCDKFVAINSTDDPYVPLRHGEVLRDKLGAELVIVEGAGHFSESEDEKKACKELPQALEKILEILG